MSFSSGKTLYIEPTIDVRVDEIVIDLEYMERQMNEVCPDFIPNCDKSKSYLNDVITHWLEWVVDVDDYRVVYDIHYLDVEPELVEDETGRLVLDFMTWFFQRLEESDLFRVKPEDEVDEFDKLFHHPTESSGSKDDFTNHSTLRRKNGEVVTEGGDA